MKLNDAILVRAKLKADGMTVKNLASKIHSTPNKVENILLGKVNSPILENRMIKWLEGR